MSNLHVTVLHLRTITHDDIYYEYMTIHQYMTLSSKLNLWNKIRYSTVISWKFIKQSPTIFGQNPKGRDQNMGEIISKLYVPGPSNFRNYGRVLYSQRKWFERHTHQNSTDYLAADKWDRLNPRSFCTVNSGKLLEKFRRKQIDENQNHNRSTNNRQSRIPI